MHMSSNKRTIKQLSEECGVSYRTMLAWNKSRPELMNVLYSVDDLINQASSLQADIDALNLLINSIHKQTEV